MKGSGVWGMRHVEEEESTIGSEEGFRIFGEPLLVCRQSDAICDVRPEPMVSETRRLLGPVFETSAAGRTSAAFCHKRRHIQSARMKAKAVIRIGCSDNRATSVAASTAGLPSSRGRLAISLRMVLSAASAIRMTSPIWP
jgi:hypothetical protein